MRQPQSRHHSVTVWQTAAFGLSLTVLLAIALFPLLPSKLHLKEGDVAAETVTAPRNFSYSSSVIRQHLQLEASRSVSDVVAYDVSVKTAQLGRLNAVIATIDRVRGNASLAPQSQTQQIALGTALSLPDGGAQKVLALSSSDWAVTAAEARRVLGEVLQEPYTADNLQEKQDSVPGRLSSALNPTEQDVAGMLVQPLVVPTETIDDAATQAQRNQAIASVPPQIVRYAKDQEIVRRGQAIDAGTIEALQAAGFLRTRLRVEDLVASLAVAITTATFLALYLELFQPLRPSSFRRIFLLAILVGGAAILARVYFPIVLQDPQRHFYLFDFPAAVAAMLVAAIFEAPLAIMVAGVIAVLVTFIAVFVPQISGVVGLSPLQVCQVLLAFFFSGVAGAYGVYRAERLNRYLLTGLGVAAACFITVASTWLLDGSRQPTELVWIAIASLTSGALASLITVGALVLLGTLFNVTTPLQLMELGQLNAPLLRRLQEEAPGTFQHSILVGNLAERAAHVIGADALLVRVGCYYHDIGKMSRPGFFIENQLSGVNPHDQLDSETSAQIVTEHVRDGRELARHYRLPDLLRPFITEHHGTRTIAYFYRKAALDDPAVDRQRFTYPGPRPQTRETAIVMLADSTEASVRAAVDRSREQIDAMVDSIVEERLIEGQLDECDLTLRELRAVAMSFKESLRAIYHPRIEYPPATKAEDSLRQRLLYPATAPEEVMAPGSSDKT